MSDEELDGLMRKIESEREKFIGLVGPFAKAAAAESIVLDLSVVVGALVDRVEGVKCGE